MVIELAVLLLVHRRHEAHRVLFDAVRQVEAPGFVAVIQIETMGEGGLQGRVAAFQRGRVGKDQPGRELPQAGARDAPRVREAEALRFGQLAADKNRGEPGAVCPVDDDHGRARIQPRIGVLVAQARFDVRVFAQFGGETGKSARYFFIHFRHRGVLRDRLPGALPVAFVHFHVVFKTHRRQLDARFETVVFSKTDAVIRLGHPDLDGGFFRDPKPALRARVAGGIRVVEAVIRGVRDVVMDKIRIQV